MKSAGLQAIEDGRTRAAVVRGNVMGRAVPGTTAAGQDIIIECPAERGRVLLAVAAERGRQEQLFAAGQFPFTCSNAAVSGREKLPVLVEEVGEVAEALQRPGRLSDEHRAHLRTELIQVAAVAVAWAESLDDHRPPSPAAPEATS